jgi:hypothetical protein
MGTAPSLPETPPQLTIKEVLEVLLLCFEAGPDTNTLFTLAYAQPFWGPRESIHNYVSWDTDDLDQPPEDALDILFPPAVLPKGLARHNMCDAFASPAQRGSQQEDAKVLWREGKVNDGGTQTCLCPWSSKGIGHLHHLRASCLGGEGEERPRVGDGWNAAAIRLATRNLAACHGRVPG